MNMIIKTKTTKIMKMKKIMKTMMAFLMKMKMKYMAAMIIQLILFQISPTIIITYQQRSSKTKNMNL